MNNELDAACSELASNTINAPLRECEFYDRIEFKLGIELTDDQLQEIFDADYYDKVENKL